MGGAERHVDVVGAGDLHAHITNRSFNKAHGAYAADLHNQPLSRCSALDGGGDAKFWEVRKRDAFRCRICEITFAPS